MNNPPPKNPPPPKTAITPTRTENYAQWFQQVVRSADMAEMSGVRGCMILKPWGYGAWELMQRALDKRFKERGTTIVISRCSFRSATSSARPNMSRASPRKWPSSPITVWR